MRSSVTVLAPAKLNLALDVVGILPGGYHALDMTMQAISLYERVVIRRSPYLDLTLPGSKVKAAEARRHHPGQRLWCVRRGVCPGVLRLQRGASEGSAPAHPGIPAGKQHLSRHLRRNKWQG